MTVKGDLPPWSRFDSAAISASLVIAAALRLWRLGSPAEPIYDETKVLRQAQSFLHGLRPPYSTHPPAGKLLAALSIFLFGNDPWGWRAANALIGTALVPITYLLARRLFRSRLAASIAAAMLLCDGVFLVASRVAMINIVYVTFGAWAYLMLWCVVQNPQPRMRRNYLVGMSLLLGLYVAAKAAISEVGVLLTLAMVALAFIGEGRARKPVEPTSLIARRIIGACGLTSGIVLLVYLAVFLPYYWFGWWSGIGDFVAYHQRVFHYNSGLPSDFPDASPFWSWPLLLHPYPYFKKDLLNGMVEVIWCGGNPLLWWAIIPAILISIVRGYTQKSLAWLFLSAGYVAYLAMWIPLRRYIFIYSYMPAQYLGLLALAGALDKCWRGGARRWEQLILLVPVVTCLILAIGVEWGAIIASASAVVYMLLARRPEGRDAKFVCLTFGCATFLIGAYFFPLWTGLPLSEAGYTARMWLHGPRLASWQ